jgi:chromosome partitioning protein
MQATQSSGDIFQYLTERGQRLLKDLRDESARQRLRELGIEDDATSEPPRKLMRTFGIEQAAKLIGKSSALIRSFEEDESSDLFQLYKATPREENNRRSYTLERINKYRDYFGTRPTRPIGCRCARVAFSNFKGGAGKSTSAVHFAQRAAIDGYRVLLIDLDSQGTATQMLGIMPGLDLGNEDTIADVLLENPGNMRSVIRPTYIEGLDLVPANLGLQDADLLLPVREENNADEMGVGPVDRLKVALDTVEDDYDIVVMDLGPNMGAVTINGLRASNGVIVPIPPAMNDLGSSILYFKTLAVYFKRGKQNLDFQHILITNHSESNEAMKCAGGIRVAYAPFVLEPHMPTTVELERQGNIFSTIYETRAPLGSPAAFKRAWDAMEKVNDAILDAVKAAWARQSSAAAHREAA